MKNKETKSLEAVKRERELYFSKQKNEQIKYRPTKLLMLKNSIGVFGGLLVMQKKLLTLFVIFQSAPSKYYKYFNIKNRQNTRFSREKVTKKSGTVVAN